MIKKPLKWLSLGLVVLLAFFLIFNNKSIDTDAMWAESGLQPDEQKKYSLQNSIEYNQLFYGKWRLSAYIPSDFSLPSSYTRLDENREIIGPNLNSIIGKEIIFTEDYAEFSGAKHKYSYGPVTYTHALLSSEQELGYHYAKTLGLTGNYYSIIYFLLPGSYQVADFDNYVNEVRIDDLYLLYLKDINTMYASNGVVMYQLERVDHHEQS